MGGGLPISNGSRLTKPHIPKNDILRETWWNHKKNNEANTMAQVYFLRQNGKKARTKLSVPGPIGTCFDVLVSFHKPLRERPTLVLACAEIKWDGENQFVDRHGTGRLQHCMGMKSPSKPSDPTRVPFLCRSVRWAVGLEPTQQVQRRRDVAQDRAEEYHFVETFRSFR